MRWKLVLLLCGAYVFLAREEEERLIGACLVDNDDDDPRPDFPVNMGKFNSPLDVNVSAVIAEMSVGEEGYVVVPGLFDEDEIRHARKLISYLIDQEAKLDESEEQSKDPQHQSRFRIRVWNLLNKGRIFEKMVQHPLFVSIASLTMGEDFQLGSVLSNTLLPGGLGQEPHLDYPYWDFFNRKKWPLDPKHEHGNFFMSFKVTIMLDSFTHENGATAVRAGTQRKAEYPWDPDEFDRHQKQVTGDAGDAMMFFGLLQHRAMPNRGHAPRTGLILQYLPKYVRPMEDLKLSLDAEVVERASPALRKMLLLDYPYPAVLDRTKRRKGEKPKYDI